MNEHLINQENIESRPESKLFGLPRPWVGVLIGVISFLIIEFSLWRADLGEIAMALNYPGLLVNSLIDIPLDFLIVGISSIPLAIIGMLFASKNMTQKLLGSVLLIVYVILWIIFSIFFSIMD
jgi:hypothetical protein